MNKPSIYLPPCLNARDHGMTAVEEDDDWLTNDFKEEIICHFPESNDIGEDRALSKISFERHAEDLFPPGHLFAGCFVQLCVTVLDMFQKAWGSSAYHGLSCLVCFYGKPTKKPSNTSVVEPGKQQVRTPSLKEKLCPFKIIYSLQGREQSEKKDNIHYRVKITTIDYEHTPNSCRLALKGAGKLIPHLAGLHDVQLSILRKP
jgi:hypothetical protein